MPYRERMSGFGNGRLGRLWQSLILTKWHPPLAINSAPFVEFMLEAIEQTLREQSVQSLELFERPQSRPETRPESTLAKKIRQTLKEKPLTEISFEIVNFIELDSGN